jgi:hypothetical protein
MVPLPALLAALLTASAAGGPTPPALAALAGDLGQAVGPPADGRRALALLVETRARSLAAPVETALADALGRLGYTVVPCPGGAEAETAARAQGQDWLLRVQAGLVPGRREVALVGEVIPTWDSFFLQRRPGARAQPPRLVQARREADPETLLLGREERAPGSPFARIRPLAQVAGRVLALAVGDAGDGPAIAAATPEAILLLSGAGVELARREPDRSGWRPVRDPAAVVALGDFGGGRLAVQLAGAPRGEVLARHGDRLDVVATLPAAPVCASEAGPLFGAFLPGEGLLADQLTPVIDPDARPRSDRQLFAVSAAPRGGPIAYAALDADLRLELLGPELRPVAPALAGVGVGFALADLDGDGTPEVVASSPSDAPQDRIRIIAPLMARPLLLESDPIAGAIQAGAGGDVTGDGVDDAVLAAVRRGPDGAWVTDLLLVTADAREMK